MTAAPPPSVSIGYQVDHLDRVGHIEGDWDGFAAANGAAELLARAVSGTSLWNYVTDATTRHLYQVMLRLVREDHREIRVSFRCDAPDRRRFMELRLSLLGGRQVRLVSTLVREEPRAWAALLDPANPRAGSLLKMCSWCKRIATPQWLEVETAVEKLALFDTAPLPPLSHGICDDCRETVLARLGSQ